MDTASFDNDRHLAVGGAALAGGAVIAGAMAAGKMGKSPSNSSQTTYDDLDEAIQKGDWAAVGVTAALLASQSYDTQATQQERISISNATLNPQRAAELDRLVEAGDWEGVVAAAARFDAQEATMHSDRSGSVHSRGSTSSPSRVSTAGSGSTGSPSNSIGSGSRTHLTAGTAGGATTASGETSNRAKKLTEIRAEVEHLVLQVVPEEQDNVDEMMLQFQGREEELVETLRSMQERQVAQKARIEGQKRAKRDARDMVETSKRETADAEKKQDEKWLDDLEQPSSEVGNATSSSGNLGIDQLQAPREESQPQRTGRSLGTGTWEESSGKATAASLGSGQVSSNSDDSEEERRKRKEQQLKEEEEALAQAKIWESIAKQSKSESEDAAAEDAADWAIARNLNKMNDPDKEGEIDDEGSV